MISEREADILILSKVTDQWRKAAIVVAETMQVLETIAPSIDDAYLGLRLARLAERGLIEARGDLSQIRHSEVRFTQETDDA